MKGNSMEFKVELTVLKKFTGCLREVSKEFPGSFKGISRKIGGCSERALRVIQRSFESI